MFPRPTIDMSHSDHELVEVRHPQGADFEGLYRIYEEALPASERKPRAWVEALVLRPDYRVMVLKSGGQVLGFLMVFVSASQEVALLEYLATDRTVRNRGLGAALFHQAVEIAGERPLLVEMESEDENTPGHEMRLRRKRFYSRLGCVEIANLAYLMPPVGASPPPRMNLAYHWRGHPAPPNHDEIRLWLHTLYTEVYLRPADDPAIEVMMRGLTA
ncbi:MAG: GNAT family N-acetyltransferase [Prosthecobacter sp.]|nr:GNAT family N-acetyltransferase [Prosthecobacter sp.]